MKFRHRSTHLCAVLFTSLFSTIAFAQASQVPDRPSLGATDSISWQNQGVLVGYPLLSDQVSTNATDTILVTKADATRQLYIDKIPSSFLPNVNFADGTYVLDTNDLSNSSANRLIFEYQDGRDFCGLGTQISASNDSGAFQAGIEAFDTNDLSMGYFLVNGDTNSLDPLTNEPWFIGIKSDNITDPMKRVEIRMVSTGGCCGDDTALYAINQVDLKDCAPTGPNAPILSCVGFAAPMANHPVKAKKNRVFPLKMELFDENGFEVTGADLIAAPVVEVIFNPATEDAYDVSNDVLSAGHGTDGNQFEFTNDGIWQFNLKSTNYSAEGTYDVTVVSGDDSEYVIDPSCVTSFIKE